MKNKITRYNKDNCIKKYMIPVLYAKITRKREILSTYGIAL